jgi:hypothetical protein
LNAYETSLLGSQSAFVTKLNPAGSALVYSTYLGGSGGGGVDQGFAIAVDSSFQAYVTGVGTISAFYGDGQSAPVNGAMDLLCKRW